MTYQTIIINQQEIENLNDLISNLNDNGILWIISKNGKNNLSTFKLIEKITSKGLKLKNIILWINKFEKINSLITNLYKNILFFVKSEDYFFDKDLIRERHIWKDVEWGKRPKNYNPKGKDPGNVWILTTDDGKGKITGFNPLDLGGVIKRCILCSTRKGDNVLLKVEGLTTNLNNLKRKIKND